MSKIVTYYSYKGGVGRTMALANTAALLSKWGYRVLVVDWDLEAPGLEHFFKDFFDFSLIASKPGVVDLLQVHGEHAWYDALIPIQLPISKEPIHLISAGRRDEDYFKKVRNFNVDSFYLEGGGLFIENLRDEWKEKYDFVLIDSRTGVTEIGGICAVQLPDLVVLLYTATDQGFAGTLDIARRALAAQQKLPYDRFRLSFIPILTKFDTQAEFKLSQTWLGKFADNLKDIYNDWLPLSLKRQDFIEATKVPYITYFSFGEKLPVIEQSSSDPSGLAYAYENLAGLIANELNNVEDLIYARERFIPLAEGSRKNPNSNGNSNKQPIKIFISSSSLDNLWLNRLLASLDLISKRTPLEIWSIRDLQPGDHMPTKVRQAIENCDIALFVITDMRNYAENFDLDLAIALERVILPLWMGVNRNTIDGPIGDYNGIRPEVNPNAVKVDIFQSVMDQLGIFLAKFIRSK